MAFILEALVNLTLSLTSTISIDKDLESLERVTVGFRIAAYHKLARIIPNLTHYR